MLERALSSPKHETSTPAEVLHHTTLCAGALRLEKIIYVGIRLDMFMFRAVV